MKRKIFKKRLSRSLGGDITLIIFLLSFTTLMLLPFVYAISLSLKPPNELWVFPPTFLPRQPTLKNYRDLINLMSDSIVPIGRYIFNSFFITVVGTLGHVIIASMAAYPLSKYKFPGSKGIFIIIRSALMFSSAVLAIPNYLVMNGLNLIDTYSSYILPAFASTLGLYLMKQFMDQMIPMPLLESADIDGASEWVKFSKIVLPVVKPAWLTLIVLSVRDLWTQGASTYIYSEELKTLPYALSQIAAGGFARAGVGAAIAILLLIFPLFIFILSQSNIMETMGASGIKE